MVKSSLPAKRLEGKVALVTGAGSGIGKAIAIELAREGCDVVINDLPLEEEVPLGGIKRKHSGEAGSEPRPDGAESTAADVRAVGQRALVHHADVSDRSAVEEMVQVVVESFGRVDVVVPCAYYTHRKPFLEIEPEGLRRTFDVTCFGTFHVMQLAARQMVAQGAGGKIVIIGSVMSLYPQAISTSTCYNAAKAALDNMTRTVATELAQHRINVNLVRPGWICTDGERKLSSDKEIMHGHATLPLGMGKPIDIARGVCYLASPDADYVTGTTLDIDGGFGLATRIPNLHTPIVCAPNPVHSEL